jgi:hypothetical protein
MTPILRNRHEKVQEATINLIGRIADRGAEFVPAKEWMRICFELLDLLKAHKKSIRRAAVNSFGYIAKAIGPQDVLSVLLTNLKVQERQSRVCSTIAIGESAYPRQCEKLSKLTISYCRRDLWTVHLYSRHSQRVPHARAQCPKWLSESARIRV